MNVSISIGSFELSVVILGGLCLYLIERNSGILSCIPYLNSKGISDTKIYAGDAKRSLASISTEVSDHHSTFAENICSFVQASRMQSDPDNDDESTRENVLRSGVHLDIVTRLLPDATAAFLSPKRLLKFEYAVRGEVPSRAAVIQAAILKKGHSYPFDKLIYCNIGNPIQVGYKPLSYLRSMLAAYWSRDVSSLPSDLKARMNYILANTKTGAYTHSRGDRVFLKFVEDYLARRDGTSCDKAGTQVFLSDGASSTICLMLEYLIDSSLGHFNHHKDDSDDDKTLCLVENIINIEKGQMANETTLENGVFLPVPQYPLYSATIERLGGVILPYELEEQNNWDMPDAEELYKLYVESIKNGVLPKAFVIINPGNPTGNIVNEDRLSEVLRFCEEHKMVVIADEVYQANVWGAQPFVPCRKVAIDHNIKVKLCSYHSTSKGFTGECGVRGGFMAVDNFPKHTIDLLDKCCSVRLCPNVTGQLAMAVTCTPPVPGDESYAKYNTELTEAVNCLRSKSEIVYTAFNKMKNITCQRPEGALYVFPKLELPKKVIQYATENEMLPDTFYCIQLLEKTGICCVPGSGFRQKKDTHHLRMTILPKHDSLVDAMARFAKFNDNFMNEFQD